MIHSQRFTALSNGDSFGFPPRHTFRFLDDSLATLQRLPVVLYTLVGLLSSLFKGPTLSSQSVRVIEYEVSNVTFSTSSGPPSWKKWI